jgi:hypothetical protein
LATCEVTPQAIWPVGRSITKGTTATHGPLGPIFYPTDKANIIEDCLENQFTALDLCDCENRRRVEAQVEALLATIDEDIRLNFQPHSIRKEIQSLELGKSCGFDAIQIEYLWSLPRRSLVHLTHLFNNFLRLGHFPAPCKEAETMTLPKPGKYRKFIQNLRPISLLSTT